MTIYLKHDGGRGIVSNLLAVISIQGSASRGCRHGRVRVSTYVHASVGVAAD